MTKRKIVVVGAGVGGLVCATKLAKALPDARVTVVEAQDKVGGLAQAWELTPKLRGGDKVRVTYELTHAVAGMQETPGANGLYRTYAELGADMAEVGPFEAAPRFAQFVTPGVKPGQGLEMLGSLEENRALLMARYGSDPHTRRGLGRLFRIFERLAAQAELPPESVRRRVLEEKIAAAIAEHVRPGAVRTAALASVYSMTKPTFVRNAFSTFAQVLERCLGSSPHYDELRTWFGMLYGFVGLPPSRVAASCYALMLMTYWTAGGPQAPTTGSFQQMHEALAKAFVTKHGGRILLYTRATRARIEDGRVTGIELEPSKSRTARLVHFDEGVLDTTEYRPPRTTSDTTFCEDADVVVVAGDPKRLLLPLLGAALPAAYRKKIGGYEMSMSLLATHVVTDLPLHQRPDQLLYTESILASSNDAIELEHEWNFPEHYMLYVNVPTLLRPRAGLIRDLDGTPRPDLHLLDIVTRSPGYGLCKRLRDEDKRGAYAGFKQAYRRQLVDIVDRMLVPGLADHVLHDTTYTAVTFDRYGDPDDGAVYSIAPTVPGFAPNRPGARIPGCPNAFLAGAAVLAGGVGGAARGGDMAANEVLKYLRRAA